MKTETTACESRAFFVWLAALVAAWLCSLTGAEAGLTRFILPLIFLAIFVMPIPAAAVLRLGQLRLISCSLVCGLAALPFLTAIAMRFPSSGPVLAMLIGLVGLEIYFWALIYSRSRLIYSIGVFFMVMLPLLGGILTLNRPGMDWVFAVSPLGVARALSAVPEMPPLGGIIIMHILILGLLFLTGLTRTAPLPQEGPEA